MNQNKIIYISYEEIDFDKWDNCMANAPNSLVYSQSWYLDKVCDTWDALIMGDYQYVMPLTYKRKYGIRYLVQPIFCQQLGIFPTPTKDITKLFFDELLNKFSFADIHINSMNLPLDKMNAKKRKNYLLSLSKPHSELKETYSPTYTKRKIERALKNNLSPVLEISIKEYLQLKKEYSNVRMDKQATVRLHNLLAYTTSRNTGKIFGVYSPKNTLCAAAVFIKYKKRIIYLNSVSSTEGKKLDAMFYLIDWFISENQGKDYLLDFEGSMIPGVAAFFKGFGATPEYYYRVSWNNLPPYIKWLKK